MSNPQKPTVFYVQQQREPGIWEAHGEAYVSEAACVARVRQLEAENIAEQCEAFELTDLLNMGEDEIEDLDREELIRCILATDAGLVSEHRERAAFPRSLFSYNELELVG